MTTGNPMTWDRPFEANPNDLPDPKCHSCGDDGEIEDNDSRLCVRCASEMDIELKPGDEQKVQEYLDRKGPYDREQ